jgi:hypothetical protein
LQRNYALDCAVIFGVAEENGETDLRCMLLGWDENATMRSRHQQGELFEMVKLEGN